MERRNSLLVILLAAILGSAAIAPRSSGRSYEAPTAAPTQSPTRSEKSGAELRAYDARGIINEFFSGTANDSLDKSPSGELTPRRAAAVDYQGWTVESLIATLPDPVESGLGSMFDDFVDSIEHAVTLMAITSINFTILGLHLSSSPVRTRTISLMKRQTRATKAKSRSS